MATLLVPLDGTELAEQALPYARLMARLFDAEVHLLHVATVSEEHDFASRREQLRQLYTPTLDPAKTPAAALARHDEAYLKHQLTRLQAAGVRGAIQVVFGEPERAIIEAAEACDAELIVMATHGRGTLSRLFMGSVAHRLLELTRRPLLAARSAAPAAPAIGHILVPLDGSTRACEALPYARDLARRTGGGLTLLTVLAPHFGLDPAFVPAMTGIELAHIHAEVRARLEQIAAEAPEVRTSVAVVEGLAGETICGEAGARGADLIVMASHGHGGRRLLSLGSVTDGVLHGCRVPVLVVPTRLQQHGDDRDHGVSVEAQGALQ